MQRWRFDEGLGLCSLHHAQAGFHLLRPHSTRSTPSHLGARCCCFPGSAQESPSTFIQKPVVMAGCMRQTPGCRRVCHALPLNKARLVEVGPSHRVVRRRAELLFSRRRLACESGRKTWEDLRISVVKGGRAGEFLARNPSCCTRFSGDRKRHFHVCMTTGDLQR